MATWLPKPAREDRPVHVGDQALTAETATALSEALMLPRDLERNRLKAGGVLVREAVRHLVLAAQEVKVLGEKYAAQEKEVSIVAKKNVNLLGKLSTVEASSLKHKKRAAELVTELDEAKLELAESKHQASEADKKNAKLTAALAKCQAELQEANARAESSRDAGFDEATAQYIAQLVGIQDGQYLAGWTAALEAAEVPQDSHLYSNVPVPSTWSDDEDGAGDNQAENEEAKEAGEQAEPLPQEMNVLGSLGPSDGLVDPSSSREVGEIADQIIRDVGLQIQANINAEEAEKKTPEKAGDELVTTSDKELGFV